MKCLVPAFDYLEKRLTGNCRGPFSCEHTYLVFELCRVFDPSFVSEALINQAFVRSLAAVMPLTRNDGELIRELERDSHIVEARGFSVDHRDVDIFSQAVFDWWRNHGSSTGVWRKTAEIVFHSHRTRHQPSASSRSSRACSATLKSYAWRISSKQP